MVVNGPDHPGAVGPPPARITPTIPNVPQVSKGRACQPLDSPCSFAASFPSAKLELAEQPAGPGMSSGMRSSRGKQLGSA